MKVYRYWAKETLDITDPLGKNLALKCWRGSDFSLLDAQRNAKEAILSIALQVRQNSQLNRYSYGERPLREELVDLIQAAGPEPVAALTRNAYGATILNSSRVMFIDIDFPQQSLIQRMAAGLRRLLGYPHPEPGEEYLHRIDDFSASHPDLSLRIYRTFGGLRCLVTNQTFDPSENESTQLLENMGSDPLYVRLCKNQGSFRARLSPKPWRCGMQPLPIRYPWENDREQQAYMKWVEKYRQASSRYSVCKYLGQRGPAVFHPEVRIVQQIHDRHVLTEADFPLA